MDEEVMDNLDCSGPVVIQTLRELDIINNLLGGNSVTLSALAALLKPRDEKQFSVIDLGCGSGDTLALIQRWGEKNQVGFSLTGIDANANIIEYARSTSNDPSFKFEAINVLSGDFLARHADVFVATLFTHHFSDDELVHLLSVLNKTCRVGIIINDIHRHWLAYYSIKFLTRVFSRSSMVRFDAPLSVLRAFRRNELQQILQRAGITAYTLRWRWAFRWQLIITK